MTTVYCDQPGPYHGEMCPHELEEFKSAGGDWSCRECQQATEDAKERVKRAKRTLGVDNYTRIQKELGLKP